MKRDWCVLMLGAALSLGGCVGDALLPGEPPEGGGGGQAAGGAGGSAGGGGGGSSAGGGAGGGSQDAGAAGGGGGGEDAGTGGGAPSDAGGCPGTFCDDFEQRTTGSPPGAPWTLDLNPGSSSVVVDSTHVHSGAKALKLAVPVGGNRAFAVLSGPPVFPTPVNDHYGRMWIWISPMTGANGSFTHIDNIEATGRLDGGAHPFERVRYGAGLYSMDTHPTFYGNFTDDYTIDAPVGGNPPVPVPMQQWSCYEWHFGTPGMVGDFWFNGTRLADLSPPGYQWNSSWKYPPISSVSVGWQAWGSLPVAMTVWVDDVAVGTSRLGCQ